VHPEIDVSDEPVTESLTDPVQTWGSLQIVEAIGSGGFGAVYRAWEPTLAREVALKIIRPRDPRPETLAAVLREGQLLARVRHANVVTIYSAQQIGDEIGLCMEFVQGRSLAQLVKEDGPRAAAEAAVIGVSVCQALAAVHQAKVLHRDIKAQNVMRESGGRIVLMDFGAGQLLDGSGLGQSGIVGTLPYMAPEVLVGAKASEASDIYSLGVLLFYLVTGTYPVDGRRTTDFLLAHSRSERRSLTDLRPDIAPEFVRLVERATALHPKERYQSPGTMLKDLLAFVRAEPAPPPEPVAVAPPPPKPRPRALRTAGTAALAVLGVWILGGVTSIAFNHTLGLEAAYRTESALSWPVWGVRALVATAVKVTML
jgi:serine/threonine protein kinase